MMEALFSLFGSSFGKTVNWATNLTSDTVVRLNRVYLGIGTVW